MKGVAPGVWTASTLCSVAAGAPAPGYLIAATGGVFYGAAGYTDNDSSGAVLQISLPAAPGGTCNETVLHSFGGGVSSPNTLILASDGTLYGTAYGFSLDGGQGTGAAFQITPPSSPGGEWTYTLLKDFGNFHPSCPLIPHNGNLYGALDGNYGFSPSGLVFELQPPATPGGDWTTTYLHQFTNGQMPLGALLMEPSGAIYGTTVATGTTGPTGTIYRIVP